MKIKAGIKDVLSLLLFLAFCLLAKVIQYLFISLFIKVWMSILKISYDISLIDALYIVITFDLIITLLKIGDIYDKIKSILCKGGLIINYKSSCIRLIDIGYIYGIAGLLTCVIWSIFV